MKRALQRGAGASEINRVGVTAAKQTSLLVTRTESLHQPLLEGLSTEKNLLIYEYIIIFFIVTPFLPPLLIKPTNTYIMNPNEYVRKCRYALFAHHPPHSHPPRPTTLSSKVLNPNVLPMFLLFLPPPAVFPFHLPSFLPSFPPCHAMLSDARLQSPAQTN